MSFIVTYRDPSGSRKTLSLDATDRSALFAELARRGITAVSVAEGRADTVRSGARHAPFVFHGVLALLAVVAVGFLVYMLVSGEENSVEVPKRKAVVAKVEPSQKRVKAEKPMAAPPAEVSEEVRERERVMAMTAEEREEYLVRKEVERPINLAPSSNQVFATGTEQLLSHIFTKRLGDAPPPLPEISINDEAHLVEILENAVKVGDEDDERIAEAKEMVGAAKEALAKYLKDGGDIHDFLTFYRDKLVAAHQTWIESQQLAMRIAKDPQYEPVTAAALITEINRELDEKGIKSVILPPAIRADLGLDNE